MAVQMIIKNADFEKKIEGKKNIIDEISGYSRNDEACGTDLCKKRVAGSNNKILLRV